MLNFTQANIAFLGAGAMGSRMAASLLNVGHKVTIYNRTEAKTEPLVAMGAAFAQTPKVAVQNADFVFCMVRDDAASRSVWCDSDSGALASMQADAIAIECSTLTPAWTRELGRMAAERSIDFLEAPLAGSRPQAEASQLVFFAAGEQDVFRRTSSLLSVMGSASHYIGPVGNGALLKLFVNAMFGVQIAALAELIGMLRKTDIDIDKAMEVFGLTPVASPAAKGAIGAMLKGNFEPMFPLELVVKDLGYVVSLAAGNSANVPVTTAIKGVVEEAIGKGLASKNITALVQLYASTD